VDLQTDPVAQTVAEVLPVAGLGDHRAGRAVDLAQFGPGHQCRPAGPLGLGHQRVDLPLPRGRGSQHEGAGHVRVVAADQRTEVDLHEIPGPQFGVGGPVMRDSRIGAGGDDRLEGPPVGAVFEHQELQFAGHRPLSPPRTQSTAGDQRGQGRIGRLARQPQQRHLTGVLDLPKALDDAPGPGQRCLRILAEPACERVEAVDGDHVALESDPRGAVDQGTPDQVRCARPLDHHLQIGGLAGGLGQVPGVGGQHRRGVGARSCGEHQQSGVGAGEPRQIPHVDQVAHHQRVQTGGRQRGSQPDPALGMCHGR